jgi:hypothetical protein
MNRGDHQETIFGDDEDRKPLLAAKLRAQSTITVSWIAQRLALGTRGQLAHLLYRNAETSADRPQSNQRSLRI